MQKPEDLSACLLIQHTARIVRKGVAAGLRGHNYDAYIMYLFPERNYGRISITVTTNTGRRRNLTYLLGDCDNRDVDAVEPGPDHEVHVVYGLVTFETIKNHVHDWVAAGE